MIKLDIDKLWMKLTDAVDIDHMTVEQATDVYEVFGELVDQIEYLEAKLALTEAQVVFTDVYKPTEDWTDDFTNIMDAFFTGMREKGEI